MTWLASDADRGALMRLVSRHPIEAPPPDLGRERRQQTWRAHLRDMNWQPKVSRGPKPPWLDEEG